MESQDRQAAELWEKFSVLTSEMLKFLKKEKIDRFLELLDQRLRVQRLIEAEGNTTYHMTPEGRALIGSIHSLNADIRYQAQLWMNKAKQGKKMAKAYDSLGMQSVGRLLNQKF